MDASILIVTRNRKNDLEKTLSILKHQINTQEQEVLVFIDGSEDDTILLKKKFSWVNWFSSKKSIGASRARYELYKKANGKLLFGFDDDAHPLQDNFIQISKDLLSVNENVAIIAFQEIRGIFKTDAEALQSNLESDTSYLCSEFVGCGFVIKKICYEKTGGFPQWIDIYGEEACVSLEIIDLGYDILFSNKISVNHRVNKELRVKFGANHFRFKKQLLNASKYYLVYYKKPLFKVLKLYAHNFKKYAIKDYRHFWLFLGSMLKTFIFLLNLCKWRKPVSNIAILKRNNLPFPNRRK